jgi:hypothetical protein
MARSSLGKTKDLSLAAFWKRYKASDPAKALTLKTPSQFINIDRELAVPRVSNFPSMWIHQDSGIL